MQSIRNPSCTRNRTQDSELRKDSSDVQWQQHSQIGRISYFPKSNILILVHKLTSGPQEVAAGWLTHDIYQRHEHTGAAFEDELTDLGLKTYQQIVLGYINSQTYRSNRPCVRLVGASSSTISWPSQRLILVPRTSNWRPVANPIRRRIY